MEPRPSRYPPLYDPWYSWPSGKPATPRPSKALLTQLPSYLKPLVRCRTPLPTQRHKESKIRTINSVNLNHNRNHDLLSSRGSQVSGLRRQHSQAKLHNHYIALSLYPATHSTVPCLQFPSQSPSYTDPSGQVNTPLPCLRLSRQSPE